MCKGLAADFGRNFGPIGASIIYAEVEASTSLFFQLQLQPHFNFKVEVRLKLKLRLNENEVEGSKIYIYIYIQRLGNPMFVLLVDDGKFVRNDKDCEDLSHPLMVLEILR